MFLRKLIFLAFCSFFYISSSYSLTADEIKVNVLKSLDNVTSYVSNEHSESVSYPKGANKSDYPGRVSETFTEIDFANMDLHIKSVSQMPAQGGMKTLDSEYYLFDGTAYQYVNGQWVKMPAGEADLAAFNALDDDKALISTSTLAIVGEDQSSVMVIPDENKFLENFRKQFSFFAGANNPGFKLSLDRVGIQYWLDKDFNIVKKDVGVTLTVSFDGTQEQTIKYYTRSVIGNYNQIEAIRLSPEASGAQPLYDNSLPDAQ